MYRLVVQSWELIAWIDSQSFRLVCPLFTDEFVWGQASQCLQSACEVVGVYKIIQMSDKLLMVIIMIALHRRFLDRAVHAFDLAVRPGMVRFAQAMCNAICLTDQIETHLAARDAVAIAGPFGELDPVIRQVRGDLVGHHFE